MKRTNIFLALIMMLTLTAQTAAGQVKTATIKGYSPELKDSTVVVSIIDMMGVASDTVRNGRFTLNVPVEKLTMSMLFMQGEGCPRYLVKLYLTPDLQVNLTGTDCLYPTWKVESLLPEQATANTITEHHRDALAEYLQLELTNAPSEKQDSVYDVMMKQTMDILPTLPIDLASTNALEDLARYANGEKDFPYTEQLKDVEKYFATRAPESFNDKMAYIHSLVYPLHIVQPGEEAIDADFFDMQGNPHHLAELRGQYALLDFWSLGCGPCRMAEPEMRAMREQLEGKLEIVGINQDKTSGWQESEWSKKIVWQNWSDGKMGKGGINSRYCDEAAVPYYVLLSPDHRVVWKHAGYATGMFFGLTEAINGPSQDNVANLQLAVRKVETGSDRTTLHFRYYGRKEYWFRIANSSFLMADGKKYCLTSSDGIKLDAETYPTERVSSDTDGIMSTLCYTDFTLSFEPFESFPTAFDFKEGDDEGAFVIRNISTGK